MERILVVDVYNPIFNPKKGTQIEIEEIQNLR